MRLCRKAGGSIPALAVNPLGAPILAIHTNTDAALKSALSAAVRRVEAEIPTYNKFVMRELVARSATERRFVMLLLAGVGIYGAVSQAVAQRTQEIGVRTAGPTARRQRAWPG